MTLRGKALIYGPASEFITPFTAEGKVDWELLKGEVEFLVINGITGLFVNGLASEALMMNMEERVQAADVVVKAVNGRIPVMGNIIQNSVQEAQRNVKLYEEVGVNAVVITPPLVYKYTNEGLYNFFSYIAKSTELPVYVYNAPETGNKVPPEVVAKLFQDIPNLTGYKDSTQDIIHLQTLLGLLDKERHFELLAGSDAQTVVTMQLGGLGVISLITCVFPQLVAEECKAAEEGDWDRALELQKKILNVRKALKTGPFMAAYKYVGKLVGNPLGEMKWPLSDLTEKDKEIINKLLANEGVL